jgi:predicted membrane channel-forming protein YqfA (hemolysin III family)
MTDETCNNSNRWSHWFGTMVFGIVAMVSLTSSLDSDLKSQATEVKWVYSALLTSLLLAGLAVFAHGAKDKFIGTPVETGLVRIES